MRIPKFFRIKNKSTKYITRELDQLFNAVADGLLVIDKDFNIICVNKAFLRLTGLSKRKVLGKKCYAVFHDPSCQTHDCPLVKICEDNHKIEHEVEKELQDGTRIPYFLTATPFQEPDGKLAGIIENFKDITKYKQIEKTLRETEERFRIAAENAGDLIYEWNIMNGNIEWFGDIDGLLGYAPGEFPRTKEARDKIIHPEDHDRVMAGIEGHLKERGPYFQEYRVVTKYGDVLYWTDSATALWDENNRPYKWIGVITDISAQRRAEKLLQKSEALYKSLFDDARDAIFIADIETGLILNANRGAEKLLHQPKKEIIGLHQTQLHPPGDADNYRQTFKELIEMVSSHSINGEIFTSMGERVPVEITASVIEVGGGQKVIQGIFRDISERKRLEEEREKMQAHLFDIQKMEAINTLTAGIAHDYNNLLTAVIGNLSLVKLSIKPEANVSNLLQEIEKATRQAKNLTRQLLIFSKGSEPVKKIVPSAELLKKSVSFALSGSKVKGELSLPDNLWCVEIDEEQIQQVINSLIINTEQALPSGGIITIGAENKLISKKNDLPVKEGKYIKISIQDQGAGIPKEHLSRIFDPYFTTKIRKSGLGLSIAHSIIQKHEGHISVESIEGKGTTFSIYLPASEKEIFRVEEVEEKVLRGQGKILFMDDQENIRNMVKQMAIRLGYEVTLAADGAEVCELYKKAKESGYPFEVVILDLTIPGGMGGKETIQKLLKIDPEAKVIVSSGYSNDPIMAKYERYGFKAVIAKPYEIEKLSETLNQVLREKEKLRKNSYAVKQKKT